MLLFPYYVGVAFKIKVCAHKKGFFSHACIWNSLKISN